MRAFVVLGLVFSYQAKRLAWGTSPKWPILHHKTTTKSIKAGLMFVVAVRWNGTARRCTTWSRRHHTHPDECSQQAQRSKQGAVRVFYAAFYTLVTFSLRHSQGEMYVGHGRLLARLQTWRVIIFSQVCLCVSDRHFYPSTLTDFDETWSQAPCCDLAWPRP